MKKQTAGALVAFLFATLFASAQPVARLDAVALLDELAAPPTTIEQAFERTYPANVKTEDIAAFYRPWLGKLEKANQELQTLAKEFYLKNPMGVQQPAKSAPVSKASPEQQAAINAATSELMQKMLNDPAFAQKFTSMSESEQHAYMAKMLADKGLKPANGKPDSPETLPPGSDIDWAGMANEMMQNAVSSAQWTVYTDIQMKYSDEHAAVSTWATEQIKKLPLYSFGEYGHDHDPEQVKAVQRQAAAKHRDIAERMLKESVDAFNLRRQEIRAQMAPFNDALKQVSYGKDYNFGLHYQLVLNAQTFILGQLDAARSNAEEITREAAKWEYEYKNFE